MDPQHPIFHDPDLGEVLLLTTNDGRARLAKALTSGSCFGTMSEPQPVYTEATGSGERGSSAEVCWITLKQASGLNPTENLSPYQRIKVVVVSESPFATAASPAASSGREEGPRGVPYAPMLGYLRRQEGVRFVCE